jgi:hypothetical protein
MWCGGGHLHKECPEEGNAASTPACCNRKLAEGEKPHPSNYRGCSHAKEEKLHMRSQIRKKTTTGRVFSSNHTTPGLSVGAAVRKTAETTQQPPSRQPAVAGRSTKEQLQSSSFPTQQETGQSVQASSANVSHLDNMIRMVTAVQQIMTVQWCCARRRNDTGHHENCPQPHEAECPVEFIGPSKS